MKTDLEHVLWLIVFYLIGAAVGAWRGYKRGLARGSETKAPVDITSSVVGSLPELIDYRVAGEDYILRFSDGDTYPMYRGRGTVWHEYPGGRRCDMALERILCSVWTRLKWKQEDTRDQEMLKHAQAMMNGMVPDTKKNRVT